MSINDIGIPGQPMDSPPLTEWQAAVRGLFNGRDVSVDERIADQWVPWVPTVNGGSVSAADCRYRRTPGGLAIVDAHLTVATVTGNFSISLPVAASKVEWSGTVGFQDVSAGTLHLGMCTAGSVLSVYALGASGLRTLLGPTVPFAWAAGDLIHAMLAYPVTPL